MASRRWATWQVLRAWRVTGGATAFRKELRLEPGSTDIVGIRNPQLANDPDYQWSLRSSITDWGSHEFRRDGPPRRQPARHHRARLYRG